jgi:hypothetical protein
MVNNFCPFCGTKLENGAFCGCPDAQAQQPAMAPPPPPPRPQQAAPPFPPPPPHPQQKPVIQPAPTPPPAYQPPQSQSTPDYSAHIDTAKQTAIALGGEAKSSLGVFMRSPLDMAATHSFSRLLSIVLLSLDALLKAIFVERLIRAFMAGAFRSMAAEMGGGFEASMLTNIFKEVNYFSFQHYILLFLIMTVQTFYFAGLTYMLPKLSKGQAAPITMDTAFSAAAVTAIPWIVATLASSLLITVLSYSGISVYIMFLLCGAALIMSVYLLDAGVKKYIADDKRRMNILAVAYGVQIMFLMVAIFAFIPGRIVSAISQIM